MNEKYIIDTDIGDDIDDVLAIAYAVKSHLNIVGITTVFRNADKRAKMAKHTLKLLKRKDIPVFAGENFPIKAPIISRENDQYNEQGEFIPCQYSDVMDSETYENMSAVEFIINTIRENPHEITIILIGPQTNMARALEMAPDIGPKIKEIIAMAGSFYEDTIAEWNVLCVPEAAEKVLAAGIPMKFVGLDVTKKCCLKDDLLQSFLGNESCLISFVNQLMKKWSVHYGYRKPVLHDPLTIGILLQPYVDFKNEQISIGLSNNDYGFTRLGGALKAKIGAEVDAQKFMNDFIRVVCE